MNLQEALLVQLIDFACGVLKWDTAVRCVQVEYSDLERGKCFQGRLEGFAQRCWRVYAGLSRVNPDQLSAPSVPRYEIVAHLVSTVESLRSSLATYYRATLSIRRDRIKI